MRPRRLRRLLALSTFGAILAGTTLGTGIARADDLSGCQDDFWFTFGSTRRVLCDGVTRPDGSWLRAREFYTPAHQVPLRTSCYGSYYVSCTTTGGYYQERTSTGVETYIVTPDTVLPDEPGHLVNGFVA